MKTSVTYLLKALFLYTVIAVFISCSNDDNGSGPDPGPNPNPDPSGSTILMFISKEQTYYSEYKITLEALQAAGYTVEVRSSGEGTASVYTASGDLDDAGNQTTGASYNDFTTQFQAAFGATWNSSWNETPASVPLAGRIQDVSNMSEYEALVIPGGRGAVDYRMDDTYVAQGDISADEVKAAAEKLNELAIEALTDGKPVMALCHGASVPAFFRVPGTEISLLAGQNATGFPLPEEGVDDVGTSYEMLGVNYRAEDRVTISSPSEAFNDNGAADYKIITTRDWYTQSLVYASRAFLNVMETYPSKNQRENTVNVLILHGGAVDIDNCAAGNQDNDVPCNHGVGDELPADYTHLRSLLVANSVHDDYSITVDDINLFNETPTQSDLEQYDVVIFYKHWSSGVTTTLQNALISYADNGGGVVGLHHAIYNQPDGDLNKDLLVNQLFGVESSQAGFGLVLTDHKLFSTNYGHFVSTYGVELTGGNLSASAPGIWLSNLPSTSSNLSFSRYQNFDIYDEIYTNLNFTAGQTFGREENEITPLFSNDLLGEEAPVSQLHTSGFVKLFNPSDDESVGRIAFFQPGERRESMTPSHRYGQVVRNAVVWAAQGN